MSKMRMFCGREGGLFLFFFFQAEDGIRDLVRSRGLGDVYKRQGTISLIAGCSSGIEPLFAIAYEKHVMDNDKLLEAVSYTHLTLPTIYSV